MTGRKISCLPLHLPLAFVYDIPIKMARVDKVRVLLSNGSGCAATETVQSKMHCNLTIVETRGGGGGGHGY